MWVKPTGSPEAYWRFIKCILNHGKVLLTPAGHEFECDALDFFRRVCTLVQPSCLLLLIQEKICVFLLLFFFKSVRQWWKEFWSDLILFVWVVFFLNTPKLVLNGCVDFYFHCMSKMQIWDLNSLIVTNTGGSPERWCWHPVNQNSDLNVFTWCAVLLLLIWFLLFVRKLSLVCICIGQCIPSSLFSL